MYDPLGHFVYLKSHGGFSYESGRKRNTAQARRVLEHAVASGNVAKTCRYFGIPRSSFYRWRNVYLEYGEEGLRSKKPIAKSHPNQTPDEIVEKILYLRQPHLT